MASQIERYKVERPNHEHTYRGRGIAYTQEARHSHIGDRVRLICRVAEHRVESEYTHVLGNIGMYATHPRFTVFMGL